MAKIEQYAARGVWDPPTYSQAVKVTGAETILYIAGQVAYGENGSAAADVSGWKLVYSDPQAMVFLRHPPEGMPVLVKKFESSVDAYYSAKQAEKVKATLLKPSIDSMPVCAPIDPPNDGFMPICSKTYAVLALSSPRPP